MSHRDTTKGASPDAERIIIRKMGFAFEDLDDQWFGGDSWLTHLINGLHYVFPQGERFFIRSVRHYIDEVPEELRARIEKFFGQEAQHQVEHIHAFRAIEAQGFDVKSFLDWYKAFAYDVIEPVASPRLRLATTAALEHYTAVLGEFALVSGVLEEAEPVMRDLLRWHACEEIEHKSVAYDVLMSVAPEDYGLRLRGFVMGTAMLLFFWAAGTRHMLKQERTRASRETAGPSAPPRWGMLREAVACVVPRALDFLRPGFHPYDHDNYDVAVEHLTDMGRLAS